MSRLTEPDETNLSITLAGSTLEIPASTPELLEALRIDSQELVREALLWQRSVRFVAALALAALCIFLGSQPVGRMAGTIIATAVLYAACVEIASYFIRRTRLVHDTLIPALLVTADILALTLMIWSSATPQQMNRILIGGLLVVQLAVFYFGKKLGAYAAALALFGYIIAAGGDLRDSYESEIRQLLFSSGLFALVSIVLIVAYGNFRERMNKLRLFCKLVEDGDVAPALVLGVDKRPDDLTLLGRSFEAMRSRLAEQIGTDPLTGCLNRRALESRLRIEWRQAKRRDSHVAVLAIDLDHFKQINDTRGHPFGDVVLQELAGIMKATARDTDAVARHGGDEFVIVLPDTGWQGALTFAERLRRKVDDFTFGSSVAGMSVTISIGVALARGTDPISPDVLLQEADRSLYKAKSAGRNRIFA